MIIYIFFLSFSFVSTLPNLNNEHEIKESFFHNIAYLPKTVAVDTTQIGLVYFFMPSREYTVNDLRKKNGTVFKLHHFYSLLSLVKLFNPNRTNRILFYYLTEFGQPISNHYNQWLDDPHWHNKIGLYNIKFISIDYQLENSELNLYKILSQIRKDSVRYFDAISNKKYILYVTSDVIVGPKIFSCFTKNKATDHLELDQSSFIWLREKLVNDCHTLLSSANFFPNYFSFLFKINMIHKKYDLSGILIQRIDNDENLHDEAKFQNELENIHVNNNNNFKCHYKSNIFNSQSGSLDSYENAYCIFGFELSPYDTPYLQNIFFSNDYFSGFIRHGLYSFENPIIYKKSEEKFFIPNVVHLVWFSDTKRKLKFIEYLCLKSILVVLQPEKIRIHGDNQPNCDYWRELSKNSKIEWVQRERNYFKFGQNFTNSPIQHLADIARLEILYEEGGIYSDFDILWVKKLDDLRKIDVDLIAANDITSYCLEFPNNIQIGAFLAPAKSEFLIKWLHAYRDKYHLFPGDYAAVSMCEPYKLYEKYPKKVYIENKLQMIYFNGWSVFIPR